MIEVRSCDTCVLYDARNLKCGLNYKQNSGRMVNGSYVTVSFECAVSVLKVCDEKHEKEIDVTPKTIIIKED